VLKSRTRITTTCQAEGLVVRLQSESGIFPFAAEFMQTLASTQSYFQCISVALHPCVKKLMIETEEQCIIIVEEKSACRHT
jgi:hypothetical protein